MISLLEQAATLSRQRQDRRVYYFGAIAYRSDGTIVHAINGAPTHPTPAHHCEARLVRKLDRGAVVYLARTLHDGTWAQARPCPDCHRSLAACTVRAVFYTTGPRTYTSHIFSR